MTTLTQFVTVSQASVLVPIITGALVYKRLTPGLRWFYHFLVLCIFFEIQAVLLRVFYQNNMPGLHLFSIAQFIALSVVYYYHFKMHPIMRSLIVVNIIVAFLIAIADACLINGVLQSNTVSRSYDSGWVMIYTLIYFYQLFQRDTSNSSVEEPMFWFSIGVLVYFANNIVYFMIRDYLLNHAKTIESFGYSIYLSLNIIVHLLYAQSFRCFRRWKTES